MLDLLPQQREALAWTLDGDGRQLAWVGSIRSGKSCGATLAMIIHAERYSGQAIIMAGKSVGSIERNLLPYLAQYTRELGIPYRHWRTKSRCDVGMNAWHLFGAADS